MLADYFCIEKCRGCGQFVQPSKQGPFCVCFKCWSEHERASPLIETLVRERVSVVVASGTVYSGVLKKMIYRLKYDKDRLVVNDLVPLACNAMQLLQAELPQGVQPLLVPVPLHWMRLFMRGYNQSELLADEVGRKFQLPVDVHLLARRRSTKAQHGLGKEQRRSNITGAFRVGRWACQHPPPVILVDDIYTSGATIGEAAQALVKHGYLRVFAITAARAVFEDEMPRQKAIYGLD